ncbi:MAG: FixH family protein [Rhodospirillaceae bacterium]|nr:FixH family protein [Rhodospirillaceae bacterium]
MRPRLAICCLVLCLANSQQAALAHGGVVLEEDLCVINIGYLQAHFKIYLPRERQRQEFCEDIPSTGESLFVMEYLHPELDETPIDFRVIRNVTGLGRFAMWEDVARIADLDEVTVFYQAPAVVPGVYSVVHHFDEPGEFIGIVTAVPDDASTRYTAVFPFEVGFTGFGVWPLVLIAIVVLQLHLWYSSGRLQRWLGRLGPRGVGAAAVLMCGIHLASEARGNQATGLSDNDSRIYSRSGHFQVSVAPELEPLVINTIHRWVVQVLAADGAPVPSAEITVRGAMPAHDHGLPTRPEATRYLGEGRYLIEGMRFHMAGYWEVVLGIETDALSDEVVITLEL